MDIRSACARVGGSSNEARRLLAGNLSEEVIAAMLAKVRAKPCISTDTGASDSPLKPAYSTCRRQLKWPKSLASPSTRLVQAVHQRVHSKRILSPFVVAMHRQCWNKPWQPGLDACRCIMRVSGPMMANNKEQRGLVWQISDPSTWKARSTGS